MKKSSGTTDKNTTFKVLRPEDVVIKDVTAEGPRSVILLGQKRPPKKKKK